MITYLYGPDSYRRTKKAQELIQDYKKQHQNIDIFKVDLEDDPDDWQKVSEFLNQPSMFVDSKLAIVKEAGTIDEKKWFPYFRNLSKMHKHQRSPPIH